MRGRFQPANIKARKEPKRGGRKILKQTTCPPWLACIAREIVKRTR